MGVFGHQEASTVALAGLRAMQTRGTNAAGIAGWDGRKTISHRGLGMVDQVFPDMHEGRPWLAPNVIGHVRYATRGTPGIECAQPFVRGDVAHCNNGDLPNYAQLAAAVRARDVGLATGSDAEAMTALLEHEWLRTSSPVSAVRTVMETAVGAYSSLALLGDQGIAFRDPWGFRPMVIGRMPGGTWVVASETEALHYVGATEQLRQVTPGEALFFHGAGELESVQVVPPQHRRFCFFELIYFAFVSTEIFGETVAQVRFDIGKRLSEEEEHSFGSGTLVMAVPDSANLYADGYAVAGGLSRVQGFVRRHHKGRTFILDDGREAAVRAKFAFCRALLRGRRIVLLDDSIVRGTTMKILVKILREEYGVREIHLRIGSPPNLSPCYFGIDTPTQSELMAWRKREECGSAFVEGMARELGADSLRFVSMDGLRSCLPGGDQYCMGCVTEEYPMPVQRRQPRR